MYIYYNVYIVCMYVYIYIGIYICTLYVGIIPINRWYRGLMNRGDTEDLHWERRSALQEFIKKEQARLSHPEADVQWVSEK